MTRQVCSARFWKPMRQLEGWRPVFVLIEDVKSISRALDDIKPGGR
jgi:hypothetical protein